MNSSIEMKNSTKRKIPVSVRTVCDYINQNLDSDLSLDFLCEIAHCSKFHFSRQFSATLGIGVIKYINLMRLKRACYQLAFIQEKKIIDISIDANFENHESFCRAFKKVFELSPSQFRNTQDWPQWQNIFKLPRLSETNDPHSHNRLEIMKVSLINFDSTKVALLEHRDVPSKLLQTVGKFIEWRKQSKLSPVSSSKTFGVAYDDPKTCKDADFRFDICSTVSQDIPSNSQGVINSKIPAGRCAQIRHLGSHELMDDKIRYLYQHWLPESGEQLRDFPCFFYYHNLIPFVQEHELITDIYLPLV
jgi:AraC family transcriptional regulator